MHRYFAALDEQPVQDFQLYTILSCCDYGLPAETADLLDADTCFGEEHVCPHCGHPAPVYAVTGEVDLPDPEDGDGAETYLITEYNLITV